VGEQFSKEFMHRMILESISRKIKRELDLLRISENKPIYVMNQDTGKVALMTHYLDTFEDNPPQLQNQGQSTNTNSGSDRNCDQTEGKERPVIEIKRPDSGGDDKF
jgi:hypothetical protein